MRRKLVYYEVRAMAATLLAFFAQMLAGPYFGVVGPSYPLLFSGIFVGSTYFFANDENLNAVAVLTALAAIFLAYAAAVNKRLGVLCFIITFIAALFFAYCHKKSADMTFFVMLDSMAAELVIIAYITARFS